MLSLLHTHILSIHGKHPTQLSHTSTHIVANNPKTYSLPALSFALPPPSNSFPFLQFPLLLSTSFPLPHIPLPSNPLMHLFSNLSSSFPSFPFTYLLPLPSLPVTFHFQSLSLSLLFLTFFLLLLFPLPCTFILSLSLYLYLLYITSSLLPLSLSTSTHPHVPSESP